MLHVKLGLSRVKDPPYGVGDFTEASGVLPRHVRTAVLERGGVTSPVHLERFARNLIEQEGEWRREWVAGCRVVHAENRIVSTAPVENVDRVTCSVESRRSIASPFLCASTVVDVGAVGNGGGLASCGCRDLNEESLASLLAERA